MSLECKHGRLKRSCYTCELEDKLSEAQAEIEKWKSLAGQITTDWIPANQKLCEEIKRLENVAQIEHREHERYKALNHENAEEIERTKFVFEYLLENIKKLMWKAKRADDLQSKLARYEQGVEVEGEIRNDCGTHWVASNYLDHNTGFTNGHKVRVLVMPCET